jgi:hypothetical protein
MTDLRFLGNAGRGLKKGNFGQYMEIFLQAYADPRVEEYTRMVGVHDVLEMSRFLRILGPQTIQCTLNLNDSAAISLVVKTTDSTVEYIRVMRGKQGHSTIQFDVDAEWINNGGQVSKGEVIRQYLSRNGNLGRLWNTFRLFTAAGTEYLMSKLA